MLPATYNFPIQYAGDTVAERRFTVTRTVANVTAAENLTGVAIKCQFAKQNDAAFTPLSFSVGSGVTLVNAAGGVFDLNRFLAPAAGGTYVYDIQFTYPDGRVRTYVAGTMIVRSDVTK
jgi:hypothetical protein